MANNSDYKKVRTQIEKLLPAPYQSDAIGGFMENTVNRFLSKKETEYVDGYVGTPNTNAVYSRQIPEDSIIAQAHQLQPVVAASLGTEKRYMAWVDIINELEEQGVDMEKFAEWGKTDKYNWVPPIDMDKLIHFRDYFWVNSNTSVTPEYITIKSASNEAAIRVSMFENMAERYGETFPIVGLNKAGPEQVFQVSQINPNYVRVNGNVTSIISLGDFITVKNTVNSNKQVQVTAMAFGSGKTTLTVAPGSFPGTELIGQVCYFKYDGIVIDDDLTLLFEPGFKYYTRDTTNVSLLNQYATVTTSDVVNDQTVIKFGTVFTDSRIGGVASLTEIIADAAAIVAVEAEGAEKQWSSTNFWVHRSDVENFASARQANYPIIEYFRGLELNEYIETKHDWQYRPTAITPFASSTYTPPLFELIPFDSFGLLSGNTEILLSQDYGDVVATFQPGTVFTDTIGTQITVVSSTFRKSGTDWRTSITVSAPLTTGTTSLHPITTSSGDAWIGYNKHWVYNGITDELPSTTRVRSILNDIDASIPTLNVPSSGAVLYTRQSSTYSQKNTIVDPSNKTFDFVNSMQGVALLDQTDVRVYLNGDRMYGGYTEIVDTSGNFADGIEIDSDLTLVAGNELLIEVAASVISDHGFTNISIRTVLDDTTYNLLPPANKTELVTAVRFRKSEQVKSQKNQYPLFSIYNVDGTDANAASSIFEYKVSSEYSVAPELGLRVVVDALIENYTFVQTLIGDNAELYAYVNKATTEYWVDKPNKTIYKNIDSAWADKFQQGNNVVKAIYSINTPTNTYNGLVWFNPSTDVLSVYNTGSFSAVTSVNISNINPLINTIWQKAIDQYVPIKKDWNARTEVEYNTERDIFITGQKDVISFESPELTPSEVAAQALNDWSTRQASKLSPTGAWVGDWTIPDYLYYNPANENKTEVTTRELIGHFESIISSQARIPGYVGDLRSQFHVFAQEELDLGIAGNIRQYNNNFSTFLSSVFVDNIIIPDLFEFAQNQYQILLDNAQDIIISNLEDIIKAKPDSKDISDALVIKTASDRSEDSNLEFIYGDTTAFDVSTGVGVRNWIATLPSIGLVAPVQPSTTIDKTIDLYELVHHDGHRVNYALDATVKSDIIKNVIAFYSTPNNHGFVSTSNPPSSFSQLVTLSGATEQAITKGFYWINSTTKKIYSMYIDFIQDSTDAIPETVLDTYWIDTATPSGVLKYSDGIQWTTVVMPSPGDLFNGTSIETSNISMWSELEINELQLQNLLDIETRLFDASTVTTKSYPVVSDMEDFFLAYTKATGNTLPFVNTDYSVMDAFSWNYRESVFGNNYEMLGVDLLTNSFIVSPAIAVFGPGSKLYIKNSGGNDGTWTVDSVTLDTILQTATITVIEAITSTNIGLLYDGPLPSPSKNTGAESAVYWKSLYNQIYSTPYPHLEPWKLQGFENPPTWWNDEYANDDFVLYGTRRWIPVMWTNIIDGRVPAGKELPSGIISTGAMNQVTKYAYVSVNIGTTDVVANDGSVYKPDDLYPPYLDHLSYGLPAGNRSLFGSLTFEVLAPSANYVFGQRSKIEYEWRESSQFLYDFAVQSYKETPIDFVASTFGYKTFDVNGLLIDADTGNVPSYKRTTFHGEINGGTVEKFNGINQWYINYNRYTNVDTNFSNFYQLWTGWKAPLAYQFKSFIDTRTLDIKSTQIDVEPNIDYSVYVKKTNGVKSFSINGLSTTLLQIPPKIVSHDNSHLWKVQVSNSSRRNNSISYYGVRNYPFYADVDTNTMKLYTYKVTLVESIRKTINVAGDVSTVFPGGTLAKFSSGDNFTVFASTYNDATDTTTLYFNDIITSISNGDLITADVISLPWETGDSVWFTTERKLPAPLYGDTAPIGAIEYFIIKLSDNEFRVSETQRSALENLPTTLVNSGQGVHYVGQIENTFVVGNGENTKNYWRHYKLDTRVTKTINMPGTVSGIQQYVNIIDGYVSKLNELGFNFSESLYGWQTQIEKFIDYSFSIRQQMQNRTIGNRWSVKPNKATNSWSWGDGITTPPVPVGYAVNLVAANGVGLPTPFMAKIPYYMIHNSDGTFSLATSVNRAAASIPLKLLDNGAANNIELYAAVDNITRYPRIEINTFKDKISFEPPFGVVSDIITGPFSDINVANSLRDQYGDPLLISDFVINRGDTKTDVFLTTVKRIDEQPAVPSIDDLGSEGYHYISAATFYVDTYEHIIEFSDYTNDGNLIYNGFVGLNLKRLNMNFNRPDVKTLRPNIGGSSILIDNKNITTIDNIERMTDDLRYAYSSVAENESNRYAPYARETLGYNINSTEDYLESIDINEKSQFLFWQGLIQVKGSTRSIDSFINSKKFVDARIDEFWAYQVAEFGSTEEQEYPQMYLNVDDIVNNNAKFEFIEASEVAIPGYDNSSYGNGGYDIITSSIQTNTGDFIAVSINDNDRWYKQPDQAQTLNNNGLVMYFESIAHDSIEVILSDYIGVTEPLIVHNFKADSVVVVVEMPDVGVDVYVAGSDFAAGDKELTLNNRYIPFINQLTVFKNGVPLQSGVDYSDRNQFDANFVTNDVISFADELLATDSIEVAYGPATLSPEIHFEIINSNIIRFRNDELFTIADKITLWNLQSNFEAHNASKLIDVKSNTVVSNINLFDPARGMYNQTAFNDVNMVSDVQPAFFNRTEKFKIEPPKPEGYVTKRAWSSAEVGKIWLDTSELAYIPYYDEKIFTDINDRLEHWGRPAGYSNLTAYEWVESNVHPSKYAEAVEDEQGNTDIPEHLQKSGTPKLTTFYIEYGPAPDYTLGMRELKPYVIEYSAINDGATIPLVPESYAFVIPVDFLNADYFNTGEYDIYVNGIFRETKALPVSTFPSTLILTDIKEKDYVQIVIDYDVDDDIIEQAIEDGIIRQTYEYTEVTSYSDLGEEILTYYFWVKDKLTRSEDNLVSAKYIENNWTFVDYPYLVLQQLELAGLSNSTLKENLDVSYSFAISKNNIDNYVGYLQMGQFQDSYMPSTTAQNGSYTGGIGHQPDDVITLNNDAIIRVIASAGGSNGEVTDFEVMFSGTTQPTPSQLLTQTGTTGSGTGFELIPSVSNIGGFVLKLGTDLEAYATVDAPLLTESSDTLIITINGELLTEKNDLAMTGEYVVVDKRNIDIGRIVSIHDTITVSYVSNKPTRSDYLPNRYTRAVVRNIRNFVNENSRYTIRFRKDFTNDENAEVRNKLLHREWDMFRQYQQHKIDRVLWDKVTESMIGFKLTDSTELVPSVARKLYDTQNRDTTRYGLDTGQSFVNGSQALVTLTSDLNDVENEFRGIDVASFLELNSFTTADKIITSMDTIYTTFPVADVNRMFFLFLNDALSNKTKYAKLLKTSMISVYGVKVLDTKELFDE